VRLALVTCLSASLGDLACNGILGVRDLTEKDPADAGDAGDVGDVGDVVFDEGAPTCDTAGFLNDRDNCGACDHRCLGDRCRAGVCDAVPLVTDAGGTVVIAVDPAPDGCVYFGHYPEGRLTVECIHKDGFQRRVVYADAVLGFEFDDLVWAGDSVYGMATTKVGVSPQRTEIFRFDPAGAIGDTQRIEIDGVAVALALDPPNDLYVALRSFDPTIVRMAADLSSSKMTLAGNLVTTHRGMQVDAATHLLYVVGPSGIDALDPKTRVIDELLAFGAVKFAMDADDVYAFVDTNLVQVSKHASCGGSPHCLTTLSTGYGSNESLVADDRSFFWTGGFGAINRLPRHPKSGELPKIIGSDTGLRVPLEQDDTSLYYVLDADGRLMRLGK
jgi:hypothetical protein